LHTTQCSNTIEIKVPASVEKMLNEIRLLFSQHPKANGEFTVQATINNGGVVRKRMGIIHQID
jgi:hypothetical protein